jgi:hypothetical protein
MYFFFQVQNRFCWFVLSTRQIIALKQKINISLYWKCQLIGWSSASAYWVLIACLGGNFNIGLGIFYFLLDIAIGIAVTHTYQQFAHAQGWTRLDLPQLPWRIIPAILLSGIIYMPLVIVKNYYGKVYFGYRANDSLAEAFRQYFIIITATGIRLMAIWILAFHLYHYALLQITTTRENARLLLVAKESQLDNLSAQLNPHFFFNSLNTIKALAATDPDKARRAIDLLSELLRTSLYRMDNLLIPLSDEIGLVKDYLELEKMRFEDRLTYTIDMDESLAGNTLLPLSIQTLAENAIKHGIAKCVYGGNINIVIEKHADSIQIMVQNPGKLDTAFLTEGLGLKNLQERLMLQYGNKASFTISCPASDLVISTMIIPAL